MWALAGIAGLALGPAIGLAGCARERPAAESASFRDPAEPTYVRTLSPEQQRQATAAFRDLARGEVQRQRPAPAAGAAGEGGEEGVRWSDVPLAVLYACDEIEAAVTRQAEHDWGWEFAIRTVEDWPATLRVRRADPPRIYDASASVGVFGDRTDRAAALLAAFDEQMRAFGRKRGLPE